MTVTSTRPATDVYTRPEAKPLFVCAWQPTYLPVIVTLAPYFALLSVCRRNGLAGLWLATSSDPNTTQNTTRCPKQQES